MISFTIFRQCTAKSDTSIYGICYTNTECESRSGTKDGNSDSWFIFCVGVSNTIYAPIWFS